MRRKKLYFLIGVPVICIIILSALYYMLWIFWENEAMICNAKYGIEYEIAAVAPTNVHCEMVTEKGPLQIRMMPNVLEKRTVLGWHELKGTENLEEKMIGKNTLLLKRRNH